MDIVLPPKKIAKFFALVFILITLVHITVKSASFFVGNRHIFGLFDLIMLFDLDRERNIPTFFTTAALLTCSTLLAAITFAKRKTGEGYLLWLSMAAIFLFLSIDEFAVLHERLVIPLQSAIQTSGIFYFAWVIPYGIALLVFALIYLKFFLNLPRKTQILFATAGLIYITGAFGMELIGGRFYELHGEEAEKTIRYFIITTVEECMEMAGITVFIYALTSYIDVYIKNFQIKITSSPGSTAR
ncbi:MAG: hypothetical protein E3K32_10980 [wastewater metagenome]|nr:hypothetical protein [Candidatus Loosdrechtia aerotolerans]